MTFLRQKSALSLPLNLGSSSLAALDSNGHFEDIVSLFWPSSLWMSWNDAAPMRVLPPGGCRGGSPPPNPEFPPAALNARPPALAVERLRNGARADPVPAPMPGGPAGKADCAPVQFAGHLHTPLLSSTIATSICEQRPRSRSPMVVEISWALRLSDVSTNSVICATAPCWFTSKATSLSSAVMRFCLRSAVTAACAAEAAAWADSSLTALSRRAAIAPKPGCGPVDGCTAPLAEMDIAMSLCVTCTSSSSLVKAARSDVIRNSRASTCMNVASTRVILASSSWVRLLTSMWRCSTKRRSLPSCSTSFVSMTSRIRCISFFNSLKSDTTAAWSASTNSTASSSLSVAATVRLSLVIVARRRLSCSTAASRKMRMASLCCCKSASWSLIFSAASTTSLGM